MKTCETHHKSLLQGCPCNCHQINTSTGYCDIGEDIKEECIHNFILKRTTKERINNSITSTCNIYTEKDYFICLKCGEEMETMARITG